MPLPLGVGAGAQRLRQRIDFGHAAGRTVGRRLAVLASLRQFPQRLARAAGPSRWPAARWQSARQGPARPSPRRCPGRARTATCTGNDARTTKPLLRRHGVGTPHGRAVAHLDFDSGPAVEPGAIGMGVAVSPRREAAASLVATTRPRRSTSTTRRSRGIDGRADQLIQQGRRDREHQRVPHLALPHDGHRQGQPRLLDVNAIVEVAVDGLAALEHLPGQVLRTQRQRMAIPQHCRGARHPVARGSTAAVPRAPRC